MDIKEWRLLYKRLRAGFCVMARDEDKLTYVAIGKILKVSGDRVKQLINWERRMMKRDARREHPAGLTGL